MQGKGDLNLFFQMLLVSVLLRLPFAFEAVFDWDESTFVLIADSVARGHLPYIGLWDIKPPGVFLFLGAFGKLFGSSLFLYRVVAIFVIAGSAYVLAKLVAEKSSEKIAIISGIFFIFASTHFPSAMGILSEHFANFFMIASFFLLTRIHIWRTAPFFLGITLALMVLTRTNLAIPGLIIAFGSIFIYQRKYSGLFFLTCGGLAPYLLLFLIYAWSGEFELLKKSLFDVPLAFGGSGGGLEAILYKTVKSFSTKIFLNDRAGPINWLALLGAVALLRQKAEISWNGRLFLGAGVFTLVSIVATKTGYGHYFVQLVPFIAPISGVGFWALHRKMLSSGKMGYAGYVILVLLLFGPAIGKELDHVGRTYRSWFVDKNLYRGSVVDLSDYVVENRLNEGGAFFTDSHIGYLLSGAEPRTRIGHPSNIFRRVREAQIVFGEEFTTKNELTRIAETRPSFVAGRKIQSGKNYLKFSVDSSPFSGDYRYCKSFGNIDLFLLVEKQCN